MWNSFEPEEIVGEHRIIDKLELVKDFLANCKEIPLTNPEDLSKKLKEIKETKSGIYCIHNCKRKEVLYIGESKNVKERIRKQLIGIKNKDTRLPRFQRLFLSVVKTEKSISQKEYYRLSDERKRKEINFYLNHVILTPNNFLRIYFTEDHIKAKVLEDTLVRYFKGKGQCRYNFQV